MWAVLTRPQEWRRDGLRARARLRVGAAVGQDDIDIDIDSGARRLKVSPATLARWEAEELAHSFVATVVDAFAGRALSSSDLVHYLGVRYDQVPSLEQALRR